MGTAASVIGQMQRCPECEVGKHEACDGTAWNLETDQPEWCICAGLDHQPKIRVTNPDGSEEDIVARTSSGKVLTEDDIAGLAGDAPVERWCDYYDEPGQDCFTAGPAVIAAEGLCGPCAVRLIDGRATPPEVASPSPCEHGRRYCPECHADDFL